MTTFPSLPSRKTWESRATSSTLLLTQILTTKTNRSTKHGHGQDIRATVTIRAQTTTITSTGKTITRTTHSVILIESLCVLQSHKISQEDGLSSFKVTFIINRFLSNFAGESHTNLPSSSFCRPNCNHLAKVFLLTTVCLSFPSQL